MEGAEGDYNPIGRTTISTNWIPQSSQGLNYQPKNIHGGTPAAYVASGINGRVDVWFCGGLSPQWRGMLNKWGGSRWVDPLRHKGEGGWEGVCRGDTGKGDNIWNINKITNKKFWGLLSEHISYWWARLASQAALGIFFSSPPTKVKVTDVHNHRWPLHSYQGSEDWVLMLTEEMLYDQHHFPGEEEKIAL